MKRTETGTKTGTGRGTGTGTERVKEIEEWRKIVASRGLGL